MAKPNDLINKESLYQKIMPSSTRQSPQDTPKEDAISFSKLGIEQSQNPIIKSQPKGEMGLALPQKQKDVLVNIKENLVATRLDQAFAKFNCCKCDRCKKDVFALALNMLPPKYVVTNEVSLPRLEEQQDTSEITAAIVKGILVVRDNPRH